MKATDRYKIRNGKETIRGEYGYEYQARELGEYSREATPHYVKERAHFERNLKEEKRLRDLAWARGEGRIIVRKREAQALCTHY